MTPLKYTQNDSLVGGWTNPFGKILVNMEIIPPSKDENKKYLKPPPSYVCTYKYILFEILLYVYNDASPRRNTILPVSSFFCFQKENFRCLCQFLCFSLSCFFHGAPTGSSERPLDWNWLQWVYRTVAYGDYNTASWCFFSFFWESGVGEIFSLSAVSACAEPGLK